MCGLGKKNNTVPVCPQNGMLVTITHNVGHCRSKGIGGNADDKNYKCSRIIHQLNRITSALIVAMLLLGAVLKIMVTKIEVHITKIKTDERYYSFHYEIFVNGKLKHTGDYDSDHSWMSDHKKFRTELRKGYAAKVALEYAL